MSFRTLSAWTIKPTWPAEWGTVDAKLVLALSRDVVASDGVQYEGARQLGASSLRSLGFHWSSDITVSAGSASAAQIADLPTTDTTTPAHVARYSAFIYVRGHLKATLTPTPFHLHESVNGESATFSWFQWVVAQAFKQGSAQLPMLGDRVTMQAMVDAANLSAGVATTTDLGRVKVSLAPDDALSPVAVGANDYATTSRSGITRLSKAPTSASIPISVGDNDARVNEAVNVKHHGAVGDGITDDTTAINTALAVALLARRPLYFPSGTYKVGGSGTAIFTVNKGIRIYGDGPGSKILVANGVPNTRHVFYLSPPATGFGGFACSIGPPIDCSGYNTVQDNRDYEIDHLAVEPETAGVGGDAIRVDVSTLNQFLYNSHFHHLHLGDLGGKSFYVKNNVGAGQVNADSFFTSKIDRSWLYRGIVFDYAADSNEITDNVFRGPGKALELTFTAGAANNRIVGNNITSEGGVQFHNGISPVFAYNYVEPFQAGTTGSNGAVVDFAGDVAQILSPFIHGNTINSGIVLALDGFRIANVLVAQVGVNYLSIPATKVGYRETAAAISTVYQDPSYIAGGGTEHAASPAGVSRYFPVKALTPTTSVSRTAGGFWVDEVRASQFFRVGSGVASPVYPTTGAGLEVTYDTDGRINAGAFSDAGGSGLVVLQAYSRDGAAFRDMFISGSVGLLDFPGGLHVGSGGSATKKITHGVATLVAGVVVVSTTAVTASSRIILTGQDASVTGALNVSARTPGVGFTITSSVGADTGVVAWQIIEPV
jgi:hypothetical protein